MKTKLIIILAFLFFPTAFSQEYRYLMHNGYNREYIIYVPSTYNGTSPFSLILIFHGAGGNSTSLYNSGFNDRAAIMNFIAVYPGGLNNRWSGPDDDVDFVSVLIDTLKSLYNIDSTRVYAAGQSAGAFFSYRLGYRLPGRIAAIAPLAGSASGVTITSPMPVCTIHAIDDQLVSYSSDKASLASWRSINQCSALPDTIYNLNGVIGELWRAEATGADAVFYTYLHGGHSWLNSPVNCVDFILDFFYSHPQRKIKVFLTSPDDTNFGTPADISFSAAAESELPVTKVEYFAGSVKIGESSIPPYSFIWENVPSGKYLIYAKAFVNDGTSDISSNIKEIQVLLPNAALHKTAECSATESSLYPAQNAFDGDFSSRWSTPFSDPQWISVDLGGTYLVNSVTLFWETASASAYSIDISDDKQNWNSVYTTTACSGGTEYISFSPAEARYIRMFGTSRATPYGYSLWEFQVHGTEVTSVSDLNNENLSDFIKVSPNPFNSETTINYSIRENGPVELIIYNIAGQKVRTIIQAEQKAGEYLSQWNGSDDWGKNVASGMYICRLTTHGSSVSTKMLLIK